MSGNRTSEVGGRPARAGGEYLRLVRSTVDAGYFATAGLPLVAGRGFTASDKDGAPRVAVINEALVKALFPEGAAQALGQRIRVGAGADWMTVVGVARSARQLLVEPPYPEILAPQLQAPQAAMCLLVRTAAAAPKSLREAVRREVRALDADLPVGELLGMDDLVEMFYPKVMIGGLGMFAAVALALAALGLYGVISFLVNRRTQEIGVRMALGADRGAVVRMVIAQGLRLAVVGVALGLAGALALARVMSGFLFGMSPTDPVVFGGVTALLCLIAVAASSIPAWRAARTDPVVALRYE